MRLLVDTFIVGNPKTKGSLTFKGGGYAEENVRGSKEWRRLMANACQRDALARTDAITVMVSRDGVTSFQGSRRPIAVVATFWLAPPSRLPGWAQVLKDVGRAFAAIWGKAGDVDKLSRNLLDALGSTDKRDAHVYADDNQVVALNTIKLAAYAPGLRAGVAVKVYELDDFDVGRLPDMWASP